MNLMQFRRGISLVGSCFVERRWAILPFFILFCGWLSFANAAGPLDVSCVTFFEEVQKQHLIISDSAKIKAPEVLYNIKFENDPRYAGTSVTPEALVELFQMLGNTQFENASEKFTLQKGSLILGQKIDPILTAQAEYTYDKPNKVLHLVRLSVVNSKNGQEQVLSKEPLDYTGRKLVRQDYNLLFEKDAATAKVLNPIDLNILNEVPEVLPEGQKVYSIDQQKIYSSRLAFPISISGESFEKVKKWSLVVSKLDHSEINIVDSIQKKNWAITKGQFRRFVDFAKDRFFKQAFGLIVVYMVFDGMGSFAHEVAKYAIEIAQSQGQVISVKVKETEVNGNVTNRQQKYKLNFRKQPTNDESTTQGRP